MYNRRLQPLWDGRIWMLAIGLFIVSQFGSLLLYSSGVPQNVAGFPFPFLSTVEGAETGTSLVLSEILLLIDAIIWYLISYLFVSGYRIVPD